MKSSIVIISSIGFAFAATTNSFVNQDIISEIKQMTSSWTPLELHQNPFADKSDSYIKAMAGLH